MNEEKKSEQVQNTEPLSKIAKIKMRKDQFIICILAGVLLVILAMPSAEKKKSNTSEYGILDSNTSIIEEKTEEGKAVAGQSEKFEGTEEYESYMENKLEQAISAMEGAGKVKVMVTVSASEELVVEKDIPITRSDTQENDSEGGNRNVNECKQEEETVYSRQSDGSSAPYVVKTLQPPIEGVVVVAQGGDRPEVRRNITEAIVALFDIEPHKIKVVKMKSE